MVRTPPGSDIFFSFSVWAYFLSRAVAQKVSLFVICIQDFSLPHLNFESTIYYVVQ